VPLNAISSPPLGSSVPAAVALSFFHLSHFRSQLIASRQTALLLFCEEKKRKKTHGGMQATCTQHQILRGRSEPGVEDA
jgi:hypothetical protein